MEDPASADVAFELAVDATVDGDLEQLSKLLQRFPDLARRRSAREHQATLLHYVAANGVEEQRQRVPPNAVEVARLLFDAGAAPDARYAIGNGPASTPLVALVSSVWLHRAGLHAALVHAFLEAGAAVEGVESEGGPLATAVAFGYPVAAEALAAGGSTIRNLQVAAALGDLELTRKFLARPTSEAGASTVRYLKGADGDRASLLGWSFFYAALNDRAECARVLREAGAEIAWRGNEGFTALHQAAWHGRWDWIERLLDWGAPLEVENDYGGTVLDGTVWGAANAPQPGVDHARVVERLIEGGAKVERVEPFPSGHAEVDAILRAHGLTDRYKSHT